jgi:hypothetical protein
MRGTRRTRSNSQVNFQKRGGRRLAPGSEPILRPTWMPHTPRFWNRRKRGRSHRFIMLIGLPCPLLADSCRLNTVINNHLTDRLQARSSHVGEIWSDTIWTIKCELSHIGFGKLYRISCLSPPAQQRLFVYPFAQESGCLSAHPHSPAPAVRVPESVF